MRIKWGKTFKAYSTSQLTILMTRSLSLLLNRQGSRGADLRVCSVCHYLSNTGCLLESTVGSSFLTHVADSSVLGEQLYLLPDSLWEVCATVFSVFGMGVLHCTVASILCFEILVLVVADEKAEHPQREICQSSDLNLSFLGVFYFLSNIKSKKVRFLWQHNDGKVQVRM